MVSVQGFRHSIIVKRRWKRLLLSTCLSPIVISAWLNGASANCVVSTGKDFVCNGTWTAPIDINTDTVAGTVNLSTGSQFNITVDDPNYAIAIRNTGGDVNFTDTFQSSFINNSTDSSSKAILIINNNKDPVSGLFSGNSAVNFSTNGTVQGEIDIDNEAFAAGNATMNVDLANGMANSVAGGLNLRNISNGGSATTTATIGAMTTDQVSVLITNYADVNDDAAGASSGDAVTNVTINGDVNARLATWSGVQLDNRSFTAAAGPARNAQLTLAINGTVSSDRHGVEVDNQAGLATDVAGSGGGDVTTTVNVTGDITTNTGYGLINLSGNGNPTGTISYVAANTTSTLTLANIEAGLTGIQSKVGGAGTASSSIQAGAITAGEKGIESITTGGSAAMTKIAVTSVTSANEALDVTTRTSNGAATANIAITGAVLAGQGVQSAGVIVTTEAIDGASDTQLALSAVTSSDTAILGTTKSTGATAGSAATVQSTIDVTGDIVSTAGSGLVWNSEASSIDGNVASSAITANVGNVHAVLNGIHLSNLVADYDAAPSTLNLTVNGLVQSDSDIAIRLDSTHSDQYVTINGQVQSGGSAFAAIGMIRHALVNPLFPDNQDSFERQATLELHPGYSLSGAAVAVAEDGDRQPHFALATSHLVLAGSGNASLDLSRIDNSPAAADSTSGDGISGFGTLTKNDSSKWTLSGANTANSLDAFLQADLNAGTLALDNATLALTKQAPDPYLLGTGTIPTFTTSASGALTIAAGATLIDYGASSVLGDVANSGTIILNPCATCAGNTLTIAGNYQGNAGSLVTIGTVLGDDQSLTDKLIINGNSAGSSLVRVTNEGGAGALTTEGIEIISVGGSSNASFTLDGGYLVAGAYTYRLYKGNVSQSNVNNWYLRSALPPVDPENPVQPTPEYHVGAPVYESYPQSLLGLNGVSTLQQRVGNRFWSGAGNQVIAQGADVIQPYAPPEESGPYTDGNGVWGRIEGSHSHIEPRFSTTDSQFDQNIFKLQAGVDGKLAETENGTLIGGLFVQYVHGKTKTSSTNYANGEISSDGYGFGGTLTWYGNQGFYIDGQAQATWYNSDLTTSAIGAPALVSGNDGFGYTLSVETGKRFAIDPNWSVTPQAQLVYSSIDFDSFTDGFGSRVSLDKGDSLQGRLGITLDHENSWQNAKGMTDRSHIYGIANLYYEFLDGTRVDVAGVSFASKKDRVWGGIGIGGSYNWDNDKYSIYGEGLVNTSLNNFGDSYSVKGNVGFRVKW